jgi:general secretion pathway protein D
MLAGLIRDDERTVLSGTPGLSDLPLIGHLFANHHKESQQTDIILTLTPHIVRVLDLSEADLRPFRLGRDSSGAVVELPNIQLPPRDRDDNPPPAQNPGSTFPQPLQPQAPAVPPGVKKPGGGG